MRFHATMTFGDILKIKKSNPKTKTFWPNRKRVFSLTQNLSPWLVPLPSSPSSSAGHGDSRPVGGSAMCHTLHASAGEEDWHRACVTLAQFDVLCPRTGTTVGGIAMCHNHHHPLLCRISPHTCVPLCVCVIVFASLYCRSFCGGAALWAHSQCGSCCYTVALIHFFWPTCAIVYWGGLTVHVFTSCKPSANYLCPACCWGLCAVSFSFFLLFFCSTAHSRIETAEHDILC